MTTLESVTGLSWMIAAWSPRPAATWRSTAFQQVLREAPLNQR
jgi:hypothetical protein